MRRGLVLCIITAILLVSGMARAQQSAYPTRQVRIVVPYPAGGPTDLIARLVAQKLGERLGQSVFGENGGGGHAAARPGPGAPRAAHRSPLPVRAHGHARRC